MQKIVVLVSILIVASLNNTIAQRQRRADRTTSGRAAYGLATVSRTGKIRKVKKARRQKAVRRKSRAVPTYRKRQNWAG
jgi:hypothetical protein